MIKIYHKNTCDDRNVNYYFLRRNFGDEAIALLECWTRLNYKMIQIRSRLEFLKRCRNNSMFPIHLSHISDSKFYFKNYKSKQNISKLLFNTKKKILNIEIYDLHRRLHEIITEIETSGRKLSEILPVYIWNDVHDRKKWLFLKHAHDIEHSNNKKFIWLSKRKDRENLSNIKNINYQVYKDKNNGEMVYKLEDKQINNKNLQKITDIAVSPKMFEDVGSRCLTQTNGKWFINLSSKAIPVEVSNLLQLGEGFSFPIYNNKKEAVIEFIKDIEGKELRQNNNQRLKIRNTVVTQLQKFMNNKQQVNNIQKEFNMLMKKTRSFCKNNFDIIFTKADKGNITVALDKAHYLDSVNGMLKDNTTYEMIQKNPVKKVETKLNELLKRWLALGFISKEESYKLKGSDCTLSKAYGLPKIHKENVPFRIIVSSINSTLNSFADYLRKILHNSLPLARSHVKNSFQLFNTLSGKKIPEKHLLLSLDVKSLFTNIPLELILEGIGDRWNYIQNKTKISKKEFIIAVQFILDSTFFTFDNIIYKQIYGTPMGSPLSPILADIVMQDLEEKAMNILSIDFPFYYRYVDDILLLTPDDKVDTILDIFNSIHNRLQFTVELEKNRSINFLDLSLIVKNEALIIDWYKKETSSGRYLSYHSGHPLCHKVGTIYGLVDRAILLSHPNFQEKNLKYVIKVLMENAYPLELIFNRINIRIKELIKRGIKKLEPMSHIEDKKIVVLPYIKNISETIKSSIDGDKYIVGYRILNKLTGYIKRHKDTNKHDTKNNIVYKILCNNCDASYVGQTKRQLKTRIKEHGKNIRLEDSKHSVVTKHMLEKNHTFNWQNVKIMDYETNYFKRLISEMIHIKTQENGLNSMDDIECLDSSYFNLLTKIFISKH